MMAAWLRAFALTQLIEVPVYVLACSRAALWRRALIGFGASAITHPFVWFVFPLLYAFAYWPVVVAAETFAVAVEALYLRRFGVRNALLWSLLANSLSAGTGFIAHASGWW